MLPKRAAQRSLEYGSSSLSSTLPTFSKRSYVKLYAITQYHTTSSNYTYLLCSLLNIGSVAVIQFRD